MKKCTYTGKRCPWFLPICFYEGWRDYRNGVAFLQLYRHTAWKRRGYWLGWRLAKLLRRW